MATKRVQVTITRLGSSEPPLSKKTRRTGVEDAVIGHTKDGDDCERIIVAEDAQRAALAGEKYLGAIRHWADQRTAYYVLVEPIT